MSGSEQKSSWNYRLVRRRDGSFGVHEVYYIGDTPQYMTNCATSLGAFESAQELKGDVALIQEALEKEVFVEPEEWK